MVSEASEWMKGINDKYLPWFVCSGLREEPSKPTMKMLSLSIYDVLKPQ